MRLRIFSNAVEDSQWCWNFSNEVENFSNEVEEFLDFIKHVNFHFLRFLFARC